MITSQLVHQGSAHFGPLVLGTDLLRIYTLVVERDRAVLRRSEPSSRGVLTGEQTDPWDLLQPQDTPSRHRGADPPRRCGNLPIVTYGIRLYLYPFQDSNV